MARPSPPAAPVTPPAADERAQQQRSKAKEKARSLPTTPSRYGVRGIPTLMLFKSGQVAATKIGALPKGKLMEWVESVI
jgi:thioredoxin 1